MRMSSRILRLALLLALLPQGLLLGMGRGVVVCVAPGGHLRVELSGSLCCLEEDSHASEPDGALTQKRDGPGLLCGLCTDFDLEVDQRQPRKPKDRISPEVSVPITVVSSPEISGLQSLAPPSPRRSLPPAGNLGSPHLVPLRTTVLRC